MIRLVFDVNVVFIAVVEFGRGLGWLLVGVVYEDLPIVALTRSIGFTVTDIMVTRRFFWCARSSMEISASLPCTLAILFLHSTILIIVAREVDSRGGQDGVG